MSIERKKDSKWSALNLFNRGDLFSQMGFFDTKFTIDTPAINTKDKDGLYEIELAVPGYEKEEIHVELEEDVLTVSATHNEEKEDEQAEFTRKEFSYNAFRRSFSLPNPPS